MNADNTHWFAAKTYGIGWGLPLTWQGWVVFAVYFGFIGLTLWLFEPGREGLVILAVGTALFIGIVAWKGEKPLRWRWRGQ